jgi:hypothetical protein
VGLVAVGERESGLQVSGQLLISGLDGCSDCSINTGNDMVSDGHGKVQELTEQNLIAGNNKDEVHSK